MPNQDQNRQTQNRGFGSMDPQRQSEIASQGGRAAHEQGKAHQFTSEEAREAGSKGGTAAHQKGTAHQFNSEEARAAGSKGGQNSRNARQTQPQADDTENRDENAEDDNQG